LTVTSKHEPASRRKRIIIASNTSWYIHNFRLGLVRELQARLFEVVAAAPRDQTSESFAHIGVKYIELPMRRRGLNPFDDLHLLRHLYSIYVEEKPDHVFHNTIKPVIYGSIAARMSRVPHVSNMIPGLGYVFIGEKPVHKLLRPLVKRMYSVALKKSACVFFQNPDDRDYFVQQRIVSQEKATVTFGSGVDLQYFQLVEPVSQNRSCSFILLGRLLWDKGVGEYIEAARIVKKHFPEVRFQLLGKFDADNPSHIDRSTLEAWVREGVVEYLGEVADVRDAIGKADVVVLPSYREGVPKSLLEAMSIGRPIITTDAPGCKETVENGVNGLMVPMKDVPSLAQAMKLLVADPAKRESMGRAGRQIASEKFDVCKVNERILTAMGIS
jgi:glycosyltransferase involved in cell wall biosynthesis